MSEVAAGGRTEVEVPAAGLTGLMLTAAVVSAVSAGCSTATTPASSPARCCRSRRSSGSASGWKQVIAASILLGAVIGALVLQLAVRAAGPQAATC